jgi:alpha/beta superfamily hydrolase
METANLRGKAVRQSAVSFKAKGLNFEGIVARPDGDSGMFPAVVVCHPHPLFGGNMDNNVVVAVSFALVEQGFITLRFNFRGVGNSEGTHSKGELEHQEALAALEVMKAWPGVNGRKIGLAGYSFGTTVILGNAALAKKAKALAFISPPLRALESTPLKEDKRPKLVITGDRDRLVQSAKLPQVLESFAQPPTCQIVAGADHFWHGLEGQLSQRVSEFFAEHLK